jgi:hypothetical protein
MMNDKLLKSGKHPGFGHLKSQPGVYRCKLYPVLSKVRDKHADYTCTLALAKEFCASAISQVWQGKPDFKLTKPQKLNYEQLYDDERTVDFPRRSFAISTGARPDLQMCLCRSGRT